MFAMYLFIGDTVGYMISKQLWKWLCLKKNHPQSFRVPETHNNRNLFMSSLVDPSVITNTTLPSSQNPYQIAQTHIHHSWICYI